MREMGHLDVRTAYGLPEPPLVSRKSFLALTLGLGTMEHFALSVFRPLASNTVRLEVFFDDDLLDLMNEAADMGPFVTFESETLFSPPARNASRNEATRCESATEFATAIRDVDALAILLDTDRQPLTQDIPGYMDVFEAADATEGIIPK